MGIPRRTCYTLFVLALLQAQGTTALQAQEATAQSAAGSVSGTVSLPEPDGQPVVVPGVTLSLTCAGVEPRREVSNELGQFRFADVEAGACSIVAELQGFRSAVKTVAVKAGERAEVALRLDLEALHEEVSVTGGADTVDGGPTAARVERITASVMQMAPIASERFQDALPLIPGVVRGPDGLLNISGTRSNQSALMFNDADGTDPVTGEDAIELPIDAVRTVQVRESAFAPEFGLSAGAVTTVETERAGDAWHITVNDLEPRPRRRAGEFRGFESWTPRVTVGGPLVTGKLNLLESVQYEYSQTRVFGLPAFQSDTKLESFESYTNAGSYFNHQDRTSRRVEWLTTYAFTPWGAAHLLKVGTGVTAETFDGVNTSRPVDIVREDGTVTQAITFTGSGLLDRQRTALRGFGQDSWTMSSRLSVQVGARYDYDSFTGDINLAPRGSFTAVASEDGRTVIRGGGGVFYDPMPLNVTSFGQMQARATTAFAADGVTPVGPTVWMANVIGPALHTPRSVNWNLEVDREWLTHVLVRIGYQQRATDVEPVLNPITSASGAPVLLLATDGQSRYREGQITARYQFHGADQLVGSYTRSSAVGNLNDFNSYFGNIENPVIRADARGPLPWDAPNRYLFWSNLSLPRGFTVFPVVDVRTGFPLSVVDEHLNFVGARNEAGRFPTFVSLDLQVSKRFRLFHHHVTAGLKVFNITNHFNPRDYQGNLASADFGGFSNGVGRTFRGKWVFEF